MNRGDDVSPPPDHLSFGRSADDGLATSRALRRVDDDRLDATGVHSQVIVERHIGKLTPQGAQISEIRAATGERVLPTMGRGGGKGARSHEGDSSERDLRSVRHTLSFSKNDDYSIGEYNRL